MKCSKCSVEVSLEKSDLAINTCGYKRQKEGCSLEQMVNFTRRMDDKAAGKPKVPALLKNPLRLVIDQALEAGKKNESKFVPLTQDLIDKVRKETKAGKPPIEVCGYCGKNEDDFEECEGCPNHLHFDECDLSVSLSEQGRNPFWPNFMETSRSHINPVADEVKRGEPIGSGRPDEWDDGPLEQCKQCGKKSGLRPCDVNCHYYEDEPTKVSSEMDVQFPDVIVVSISKKGHRVEEICE